MQEEDRRQYFRIDQKVSLEMKVVSEQEISNHPLPTQFDVSPNFLLLSELQTLDAESSHLLRKIAEKDSNLASFLTIVHDKVERIAQAIASDEMHMNNAMMQEINLSEGGLQFISDAEVAEDTLLSIKLVFPESCLGLLLYGQCCRSQLLDDGGYLTGVEFIRMPESCRTILARQIFESQARQRQKAAEEAELS